jgi:SAM-dependent methyltransferase
VASYWKMNVRPAIGLLLGRRPARHETTNPADYTTTADPVEVPVQKEAYYLALTDYMRDGDEVLDVGCGIGYGLNLLAIRAAHVEGIDVDAKAIESCREHLVGKNPKLRDLCVYDGTRLPYGNKSFDVVTTIDVIEHVPDFDTFLRELIRVARRAVVVSTPNRRPEFTNPDGTPRNHWHLREWTRDELEAILERHPIDVDWHHINGPWEGPHTRSREVQPDTQTLTPVLKPVDA